MPPTAFTPQVNRACYSADTETLTERGWRRFDEIERGERIATVNPESKQLEYHAPIERYVYPYEGEMVRFVTETVDVLVTPEHKMWLRGDHAGSYRKCAAAEIPNYQFHFQANAPFTRGLDVATFTLPASPTRWEKEHAPIQLPMADWLELLGYYLSEGGLSHTPKHYLFTLAQLPGETAEKIQALLERLPFGSTRYSDASKGHERWNVYGQQLCDWLLTNAGGRSNDKYIPRQFLELAPEWLRILFDAMMAGDGSWDKRENRTSGSYSTVSRQLADDVQELALKLGYCAAVTDHYEAHGNRQRCYRVVLSGRTEHSLRPDGQKRTPGGVHYEPYEGVVYCFEVPNHLFVTRRNGKIGIHGNTAETAQDVARSEGLAPILGWVKRLVDHVIQERQGQPDLEFAWQQERELDADTQSKVLVGYAKEGILTRNEARDQLGMDKVEGGDDLMVDTPNGPMLLSDVAAASALIANPPPPPPPTMPRSDTEPGGGVSGGKPPAQGKNPVPDGPGKKPAPAKAGSKKPPPKGNPGGSKTAPKTQKTARTILQKAGSLGSGAIDPANARPIDLPVASDEQRAEVDHIAWQRVQSPDFALVERVVPLDDIVATQDEVDGERVDQHAQIYRQEGRFHRPPVVLELDGSLYIVDGHHRCEAVKQLGGTSLVVSFVEGDEQSPAVDLNQLEQALAPLAA